MINTQPLAIDPENERLLSFPDLGRRWGIHTNVARQRVKDMALPIIRFSRTATGVRLSDVLRAEQERMTVL
jgi:hypothetical protein